MLHGKLPRLGTGDSFYSSSSELLEPPVDTFYCPMQSENNTSIKIDLSEASLGK
jgi:hypothetical protein